MRVVCWVLATAIAAIVAVLVAIPLLSFYHFVVPQLSHCPGFMSHICLSSLAYFKLIACITVAGLFVAALIAFWLICVLHRFKTR